MFRSIFFACFIAIFSNFTVASPVEINSASAESIANSLKGVGPSKAAAIVKYRDQFGPFKSVDELKNVKGIGQKVIDTNREDIKLVLNNP